MSMHRRQAFFPGSLYYFSTVTLRKDPRIDYQGGSDDDKLRPFVCTAVGSDGHVYLAPLTSSPGRARLRILRRWFARMPQAIVRGGKMFLHDGRHTYRGSAAALARHLRHDQACQATRPALNTTGLDRILRIIRRDGGLLPPEEPRPSPTW